MKTTLIDRVRESGFSLIELMVTVVIIAILAAIAYPNYVSYTTSTRRADGMAGIMRLASSLEKFKGNCGQYTANITGGSQNFPACTGLNLVGNGDLSPDQNYKMNIVLNADPITGAFIGYTINAVPQGSLAIRDTKCGTLIYDNQGVKSVSGPGPSTACWKQ